ncbi:MAG: hypothetical protein WBW81_15040 [Methylocella sp.]
MERFLYSFASTRGATDGLGIFHLFRAQSLQIVPIYPDLLNL